MCLGVTALKREKTKSIEITGVTQDLVALKQDTALQIVSVVTTVSPFLSLFLFEFCFFFSFSFFGRQISMRRILLVAE